MKRAYKSIKFNDKALNAIARADTIIDKYQEMGLRLTLRQLYYQFVAGGHITNEEKSYKWLGKVISDGRLAGLLDWDAIEDRGRVPTIPLEFQSLDHRVRSAVANYRLPRWEGQRYYAELWVEKQALAGVLEPVAHANHVTLMVNKGYSSQSAMFESASRFRAEGKGKKRVLFYLGDHDPSGEDMVRDIADRMEMFGVYDLDVKKLALTWEQIEEFNPPPNPAKLSDSRAAKYVARFGYESWEVDALPPDETVRIIQNAFDEIIDRALMNEVIEQEKADKDALLTAAKDIMAGKR